MITSVDRFLEKSILLLEARPSTTKISSCYTHKRAKHPPTTVTGNDFKPASLTVKTYDPVSGACYRIRIHKANELSRIMSALGSKKISLSKGTITKEQAGMASVMANIESTEESSTVQSEETKTNDKISGSNKSKKNKKK